MRFFRRAYGRHVIHMLLVKKSCGSKFRSPSSIIALFPTICSHNARKFLEERNFVALIPFCTGRYRQSITRIGRFHSHLDCSPTQAIVSPAPPPALSLDSPTLLFPSVHSSHTQSPHCLATPLGYFRCPGINHRLLFLSRWWCALPEQFCLVPRLLCLSILLDLI